MTKSRRSYEEGCIAAHALDLIGDRWALLIAREMMLGPRRFGALRDGVPGISANVLTVRLGEMEAAGLVRREADGAAYALTEQGMGLWPVLRALCQWGAVQPGHDPRQFISPVALMLSMRAMCARDRAGRHRVGMVAAGDSFVIETAPGQYSVTRGKVDGLPLVFTGGTNALAAAIYGPAPLCDCARGMIQVQGDLAKGQAFIDLFSLRQAVRESDGWN